MYAISGSLLFFIADLPPLASHTFSAKVGLFFSLEAMCISRAGERKAEWESLPCGYQSFRSSTMDLGA